jgi:hypothetical protein
MKPRAMKGYEAQVSALEGSKEGKTPKCPKADKKAVAKSNVQKREGRQHIQRQLRLSLKATFKEGHRNVQRLIRLSLESNVRKRERHQNVQRQIGLLFGAMFKRGKNTEMSKG